MVNWSVDPADRLWAVLFAASSTEQALLEATSAGPAPVRAMVAAGGQPSATADAAQALVR
jgi:hypothetical protein